MIHVGAELPFYTPDKVVAMLKDCLDLDGIPDAQLQLAGYLFSGRARFSGYIWKYISELTCDSGFIWRFFEEAKQVSSNEEKVKEFCTAMQKCYSWMVDSTESVLRDLSSSFSIDTDLILLLNAGLRSKKGEMPTSQDCPGLAYGIAPVVPAQASTLMTLSEKDTLNLKVSYLEPILIGAIRKYFLDSTEGPIGILMKAAISFCDTVNSVGNALDGIFLIRFVYLKNAH